jgi:hypothetical protein
MVFWPALIPAFSPKRRNYVDAAGKLCGSVAITTRVQFVLGSDDLVE